MNHNLGKLRLILIRWLRATPTELIPLDLQQEMFRRNREKELLDCLNDGFATNSEYNK
jgi:hypothetical protein